MFSRDKHSPNNKLKINEGRPNLSMRRVEYRDINDLAAMSRLCYSHGLKWLAPLFHNRKRWRLLLDAPCHEVWVCLRQGQAIGYFTLILDRQQHEEIDAKPHPGLFVGLYMLAVHPKLFVTAALIKLKRSCRILTGQPSNDRNRAASETLRILDGRQVPWIGYVAVIPAMRGKGVATKMVSFCEQRAAELGHKEIWAFTERTNIGACGLLKKARFVQKEGIDYLMSAKQL